MTTCLHSPPRCFTFGRTPLTTRLQFFLLHPSTCLLWLLSLRPTYAGSSSPLHRNPASLILFLHPCRRSLSMSCSRSSPSSATTPSVKELCLRPRSDPSWFLSSSARGWMWAIQTTTGQLRTYMRHRGTAPLGRRHTGGSMHNITESLSTLYHSIHQNARCIAYKA